MKNTLLFAVIGVVVIGGGVWYALRTSQPSGALPTATPTSSTPTVSSSVKFSPGATATPSGISMVQMAQHATTASCWVVIDGSVYDATPALGWHKDAAKLVAPQCGKDASVVFAAQHNSSVLSRITRLGSLVK